MPYLGRHTKWHTKYGYLWMTEVLKEPDRERLSRHSVLFTDVRNAPPVILNVANYLSFAVVQFSALKSFDHG